MSKKRKRRSAEFMAKIDLKGAKEVYAVQPLVKDVLADPPLIVIWKMYTANQPSARS